MAISKIPHGERQRVHHQVMRKRVHLEVLPCPFCGCCFYRFVDDGMVAVECTGCMARSSQWLTETDAVRAWNRRSDPV